MRKRYVDYLCVAAGAFLLAFAIQTFLLPARLSTGGVSGIATILFYVFRIPLFLTTLLINLLLLFFSVRSLPRSDLWKNLLGILFLSLFLKLLAPLTSFSSDPLIASVSGGVVAGFGVGLAMTKGASTGGTDLAALMLHQKFSHVSPAVFIMIMDTVIIVLSGEIFGEFSVTFYSVLSLFVSNRVIDWILVRGSAAKSVTVISRKSDEIAARIGKELSRGVSGIRYYGYYSEQEKKGLYCVLRPREIPSVLRLIHLEDPTAFTVVSDVRKVRGEGFETDS